MRKRATPACGGKLLKELPGILNWALAGLARLLEQGHFTHCKVCTVAAEKHREDCSPVRQFITDHFTFAKEYKGKETNLKWTTFTNEIKLLVKDQYEKYGDKSISPHIVCRELAGMPGVSLERPTTCADRKKFGTVFHGACIGDPKSVVSMDDDKIEAKTGVKPPPVAKKKSKDGAKGPKGNVKK